MSGRVPKKGDIWGGAPGIVHSHQAASPPPLLEPEQRPHSRAREGGERANAASPSRGVPPIGEGITNHSLRRTFAGLLYEVGPPPPT
jgi:hypothetical protein